MPRFMRIYQWSITAAMALVLAGCAAHVNLISKEKSYAPPYAINILAHTSAQETRPATTHTFSCPKLPARPPHDLKLESVYEDNDPHRASIDEVKQSRYVRKTRDLRNFENKLIKFSNLYLKSGNSQYATCVASWLEQWAEAKAFLGNLNTQGTFARQWTLASLSSAWLQVQHDAEIPATQARKINRWLSEMAHAVMQDHAGDIKHRYRQNNHLYWAAWAVTATGVATGKPEFYDWGVNRVRESIENQVNQKGFLPLELERGKKALQYHIFSLTPLIMVAETAKRNGQDLYATNNGILHKLVANVLDELENPDVFKTLTGVEQESPDTMSGGHFAWMPVYQRRFPDPILQKWIENKKPIISRRAGGDMSILF